MKKKTITQIEIIQESDAQLFKQKVNDRLREIETVLELSFPSEKQFCALIKYEYTETIPEDARDVYYQQHGKHYLCNDCPFLELDPDRRSVSHWCSLHNDRVELRRPGCEDFYNGLMNGEYHLVTPAERKAQFEKMDREEFARRKKYKSEQQKISKAKRETLKAEKELLQILRERAEIEKKLK